MRKTQNKTDNDTSWEALAVLAQGGDKRAYSALLAQILPYIKMRLVSGLSNADWLDDIAQDVLVSVHKSLYSYGGDRPFKPWLNSIIQFRRTDFLRQHYKLRDTKLSSAENRDIFSENVTNQPDFIELKGIEDAIKDIPDVQRKIFTMMKVEGYSAKEVAQEMDMSESAVKVSAHRTANKLKDILG